MSDVLNRPVDDVVAIRDSFVDQTEVGVGNPRANCLMACVATILQIPLDSLPDIYDAEQRGLAWHIALKDALLPHHVVPIIYDQSSVHFPPIRPLGSHIACGKSPRSNDQHAVVALNGNIIHDPHPSRAGLEGGIGWWILLMPLDRLAPTGSEARNG